MYIHVPVGIYNVNGGEGGAGGNIGDVGQSYGRPTWRKGSLTLQKIKWGFG